MATRDGNVQALTPDGKTITLSPNQAVPSGSQIITDQGRVGMKLPGDSRLWVNGGSSLTLKYNNQDAQVALSRGEIAYQSNTQGTGSLAVTAANVEVNSAKAVDMKIEDNAAKVSVLAKQAAVGVKGQTKLRVNSGTKVAIPLSGAAPPHQEVFVKAPDYWTYDLEPQVPTSDSQRNRNRARK